MNFKQAIEEMKKGKKVRRKGEYGWLAINNNNDLLRYFPNSIREGMKTIVETLTLKNIESILADDWEVVEEKKKWWEPKKDEKYYIICGDGSIDYNNYDGDDADKRLMAIGSCFQTEQQSEFMVEKLKVIHELEKFAYENNEGEIDWNDINQAKYQLVGVGEDKGKNYIKICSTFMLKELPFNIYFTSEELAKKAIENIGEDRIKKYYFGVKEEES
nr:MAG TPA: Protein of unknown function (DUF2829) [Bacteriophage sp.]